MKTILLCLLLIYCPLLLLSKTIVVDSNGQIRSLKRAIELASAGDTVLVKSGTYKEGNLIIEKSITIIGENFPILDGEHKHEIFTIHANDINISGLEFRDTGTSSMNDLAAIKVLDSKRVTIIGNKFSNSFFGIYFANSSNCRIENNQLKASALAEYEIGNGIHLWKCEQITIDNNRIEGHRDGIYFEFVTNSFIKNNHSERNLRYGLHFMFSHNDEYTNNSFINNGAGVAVMYTKNVKMYGNTFQQNWGAAAYGLLLKDIRDSEVIGNHFIKNTIGIYQEGVSRTVFENNNFYENGYAIRLQASCDDNTFKRNNFSSNTFDLATNGTMVLNTIDGNYWDKYQGYDMNKDGIGDIPFRPVNLYAMIVERIPSAVLLWRSFLVLLMDRAEKVIPVATPENLKDNAPSMKPYDRSKKS
ncbi:nitrous oxide reductase family maturation protein NosD [Chryseolinea sp. H1M3-3]|uniref:nitrous oxide reductase family maturation protein NosD n=1 Tax=Chryseolinea sp. H1M3-3 TaxID=3034144 RepID=UPI0023EBEE31|nr:nitrous oxide reductase family maturation protein NosD [Chryseolinea sp. H1M3-3]